MSDVLCVTNRLLCKEDFLVRIEKLAVARPVGIILREKDLSEAEYEILAGKVFEMCRRYDTLCILHSFPDAAIKLGCKQIHLSLHLLKELPEEKKAKFTVLGASCHSVSDAVEAKKLGCTYITAGNVFDTDCKKGLPGRGTDFLRAVCESVSIPVYAIGGISADNIAEVRKAKAAGVCVMSGGMNCDDPVKYINSFH